MKRFTFDFECYLNIRAAYAPAWLAGSERIAFLTDITGTPQVWSVSAGGGWPDQLSFFQDKVWALNAAPEGDRLICTRDIGGNERYQLFLISADGVEVTRLTQEDRAIHHFGGWSHDGRRIAYVSNARNGIHFDVYVQDLERGRTDLAWQSDGSYRVIAWSPSDTHLLLTHEVSSADQPLFLLQLANGTVRPLAKVERPVSNHQALWAKPASGEEGGNGVIYLLTDRGGDFMKLGRLEVDSQQITYLSDDPWDVESLAISPDGRSLAYTVNEGGYARLSLFNIPSGAATPVTGLPDGVVAEPAFSADGAHVAVSVQTPDHNLDIWRVDVGTMSCRQVTRSSLAGIPRDSLVKPELIQYETFDGRSIPAFFYRPPGASGLPVADQDLPVILYVHGGPASQIRPDFDPRFQFFLSRGYAILAPNVRGSSGYGKAYMALDDVRLRMDSVADLKYAVDWLRQSGEVDARRIAIYGRSYGGFMVLAAVTAYPALWAAGIDVVGIGNWITFLENTGSWRRAHREKEYGSLEHDYEFLQEISPIHKVDQIQAPLLVVHGANDPRVPVTEADQIVASLRQREHPVEYLWYEDEGHKISKLKNRIDSFTKMADFLKRYL
jgi:dipeptidyl aminopeptidase/acylaminoacyl peptidase